MRVYVLNVSPAHEGLESYEVLTETERSLKSEGDRYFPKMKLDVVVPTASRYGFRILTTDRDKLEEYVVRLRERVIHSIERDLSTMKNDLEAVKGRISRGVSA